MLKRDRNINLLSKLPEPSSVFEYFLFCTETPRPSSGTELFTQKLEAFADKLGLSHERDEANNLVIRKPATEGYEEVPCICLQAHMDMVCSSNNDIQFDFNSQPINCDVKDNLLTASGTTLGADNGIGVAACMAILSEKDLVHGPIECLFTYDEETTMSGAMDIAPEPYLTAEYMINLDSEEHNAICLGCAGGFETNLYLEVEREDISPEHAIFELKISGLLGGHSGIDINKGRGNAIKLMARVLSDIPNLQIVTINAGTAINTIPRSCSATIIVPQETEENLKDLVDNAIQTISEEFKSIEPKFTLTITDINERDVKAITTQYTKKLLDLIRVVPHGVLNMNPNIQSEVQTSISFSIIQDDGKVITLQLFCRSDSNEQMRQCRLDLESLASLSSVDISPEFNAFPGWEPNKDSLIFNTVYETFIEQNHYPNPPRVYAIHAGLECGLILNRYPNIGCISIGPEIRNAHTPDESLYIDTVRPFYEVLKGALEKFANKNGKK